MVPPPVRPLPAVTPVIEPPTGGVPQVTLPSAAIDWTNPVDPHAPDTRRCTSASAMSAPPTAPLTMLAEVTELGAAAGAGSAGPPLPGPAGRNVKAPSPPSPSRQPPPSDAIENATSRWRAPAGPPMVSANSSVPSALGTPHPVTGARVTAPH